MCWKMRIMRFTTAGTISLLWYVVLPHLNKQDSVSIFIEIFLVFKSQWRWKKLPKERCMRAGLIWLALSNYWDKLVLLMALLTWTSLYIEDELYDRQQSLTRSLWPEINASTMFSLYCLSGYRSISLYSLSKWRIKRDIHKHESDKCEARIKSNRVLVLKLFAVYIYKGDKKWHNRSSVITT